MVSSSRSMTIFLEFNNNVAVFVKHPTIQGWEGINFVHSIFYGEASVQYQYSIVAMERDIEYRGALNIVLK